MTYYQIISIADNAIDSPELVGSREKGWCWQENTLCLLKIGRPQTGENWAEKAVSELCSLLNLPHAHYELAIWKEKLGVITRTFIPQGGQLILGNELLTEVDESYPAEKRYKQYQYTLSIIEALITKHEPSIQPPLHWQPIRDIKDSFEVFIGYLMLDAWIANQDRHHENWGVVEYDQQLYLTPTFDHAPSLGQNLTDKVRNERLKTRDENYHIKAYVKKAKSAIYEEDREKKTLSTFEAFHKVAIQRKAAAMAWLGQLEQVTESHWQTIFQQLPTDIITHTAMNFAMELLKLNQERLLSLRKELS